MDEQIIRKTFMHVPLSFMEHAVAHISCNTLDMHDKERSRAKVFQWQGKTWTCISATYCKKLLEVEICEVVTADRYTGPPRDKKNHFYLGGTFKHKGKTWVMTANEIALKPDDTPPPAKAEQLSFFP